MERREDHANKESMLETPGALNDPQSNARQGRVLSLPSALSNWIMGNAHRKAIDSYVF